MNVNDAVMVEWGNGWTLCRVTHVHEGPPRVAFVFLHGEHRALSDDTRMAHVVGRYEKTIWGKWRFIETNPENEL